VPEGDTLHRAAQRLQPLVGARVEVETPHPRAPRGLRDALDGRILEAVDALGKNLVLRFEGGVVLRSHLRMKGRWRVQRRGARVFGTPWLALRTPELEALQFNGPVLELGKEPRVGPDVLAPEPDLDAMVARLRTADPALPLGEALQRQRLVAGIGNLWMAEALWEAGLSPWARVGAVADGELRRALEAAHSLMRASLDGRRGPRRVYGRTGRPCPRCAGTIRARGQGDANRTAYWCPGCQRGESPPTA
jgi:endonuclease-8